jgi:hypothetical protein
MLTKALTVKMAVVTTAAALGIGPMGVRAPARAEMMTKAEYSSPPAASAGAAAGGNLVVVVPVTPSRNALRGLCSTFLAGRAGEGSTTSGPGSTSPDGHADSNTIPALIDATGGSTVSATAWCRQYLHLHR